MMSNQNSDSEMNMDHLELRDDDSDGPGGNAKDSYPKLRTTGLRASSFA